MGEGEGTSVSQKVSIMAGIAVIIWLLLRCLKTDRRPGIRPRHGSGADVPGGDQRGPAGTTRRRSSMSAKDAATLDAAAAKYDTNYQNRMRQRVVPNEEDHAGPFIGFSLADNIKQGALIVDGIFDEGPASQVGVDINHELLAVQGERVTTMEQMRQMVRKHCRAGYIVQMTLRNNEGNMYTADLWVMTADDQFKDMPFYFDRKTHTVRQSDRQKRSWRPKEVEVEVNNMSHSRT